MRLSAGHLRGGLEPSPRRSPEHEVVRTLGDVEAMLGRARFLRRTPRARLDVGLLPSQEAAPIQARINRRAAECGCDAGSVVGAAVLLGYLGYLLLTVGSPTRWGLGELLAGTSLVIGAALAGKAAAVIQARVQLVRELEHLRARLAAR